MHLDPSIFRSKRRKWNLCFSLSGLEIYSAVMKVKACQNIRDNAHDAVKNLRKANSDMDKTLRDVNDYKRKLTVNVSRVLRIFTMQNVIFWENLMFKMAVDLLWSSRCIWYFDHLKIRLRSITLLNLMTSDIFTLKWWQLPLCVFHCRYCAVSCHNLRRFMTCVVSWRLGPVLTCDR